MSHLFTSESVTEGHPDKLCDRISDSVLDAALVQDPRARVACECLVGGSKLVIAGELTTTASLNYEAIARKAIEEIGYNDPVLGFDAAHCAVLNFVGSQSPDIAQGVDANVENGKEQGAGDQGLMFGFACDETPELMPLPISLAHRIARRLSAVRHGGSLPFLRPDGKCQVTIEYADDGIPLRAHTIVLSTQHHPDIHQNELAAALHEHVIGPVCGDWIDAHTIFHINPTGTFVIGGPVGDSGLTGRKIIVDTYGGYSRHGGGAFSGKDPSKVDRSAAYAMRWIAKHVVRAGLAKRCEVQVSYAIGWAEPVSLRVDTFGTSTISDRALERAILEVFDLRPAAIIRDLDLLKPQYTPLSSYGHMGREDLSARWEMCDRLEQLREAVHQSARTLTSQALLLTR